MDNTEIKLAIGALLHDIGKIVYRQGAGRVRHSQLGADYLKDTLESADPAILDCIRYHHAQELSHAGIADDSLAYIVYIADNISSGTDRRDKEEMEGGFDLYTPMQPVFNLLNGNHGRQYYAPELLNDPLKSEINYPRGEKINFTKEQYSAILRNITGNLKGIIVPTEDYLNSLVQILESNLSYVPSSTSKTEVPDISLYDHMKLTAGMALCIKRYMDDQKRTYRELYTGSQKFYSEKCFFLTTMDISGIQKFIYTIPSKDALRSLRARSFYLDLLLEHAIDELLDREGLARTNLIYSGGGHCYLLLPNTADARNIFASFVNELNEWFLKVYQTSLYIAGAGVPCCANDLWNKPEGSYGDLYKTLSEEMSYQKSHRYTADQIIGLNHTRHSDYSRECRSCRRLGILNEDRLCPVCASLKTLSQNVLYAKFFSIVRSEDPANPPLPFGCSLAADKTEEDLRQRIQTDTAFVRAYGKNQPYTGKNMATELFVGDYTTGETFEELAKKAQGINRIGVLRADVDNLGHVFVAGFKNSKNHDRYETISRTAAFSRQMSMLFKLYIRDILEHPVFTLSGEPKKERNVAVVYSGGDDVFLAGAWDDIIEAACDLHSTLTKYTEGTLTISAGIGIYHSSYPISVIAQETARMEDRSKAVPGKNAVTLFDHDTYHWQEFTDHVIGEKYRVINDFFHAVHTGENDEDKVEETERGNSLLYRILELIRHQDDRINFARYVYLLSRLEPDEKASDEAKNAYRVFSGHMYDWIQPENKKDQKELETAITIYVYLHRQEEGET